MLILKMLDELSLSPTVRAETLPLAMFVEMARFYEANA
jgi:hypothetical protein